MTENLLEASLVEAQRGDGSDARAIAGERSPRPAGLPDKFWDERTGQVRLDALIKSYLELERKLGAPGSRDIPAGPEHYTINIASELLSADPEVNRRLHAAGFTQQQAQLVYDLAGDRLMPMIAELATMFEAESQIERLTQHFGGEERWREVARQINAWAGSHLPARVFEALSTTFEGVLAMYRMMSGEEPGFLRHGEGSAGTPSEAEIKQLMRDPRYWRQQDPAVVDQVREGFRQLYKQRGLAVSAAAPQPLTCARSLSRRERVVAVPHLLPLPAGEGWGEGLLKRLCFHSLVRRTETPARTKFLALPAADPQPAAPFRPPF